MLGISVCRESSQSLQLQVVNNLRLAINTNRLAPGEKLPPSRLLASEIGVSRNLVTTAYEQLTSEGYLSATVGRGTFVSAAGGNAESESRLANPPEAAGPEPDPAVSGRLRYDFIPGRPDMASIPAARWNECLRDGAIQAGRDQWGYGEAEGDPGLQKEIASWLHRIRGMEVHPDRIVVTNGTAQSLLLAAQGISPEGMPAFYCEDPSIPYARNAFHSAGFQVKALPSDDENVLPPAERGIAYLTPGNRFPRGGTMRVERRRLFTEWSNTGNSLILEDDYDSEFRYSGAPSETMVSHEPDRVMYLGTFSKCLFPGARLAYLVVPDRLRGLVLQTKTDLFMRTPVILQKALARFLERGYLDRHVLKMKQLYRNRRNRIVEYLDSELGTDLEISGRDSGYHLSLHFPGRRFDEDFFTACTDGSVAIRGEGHYAFGDGIRTDRLVIGYGNIRDDRLEDGLERLVELIRPGKQRGRSHRVLKPGN